MSDPFFTPTNIAIYIFGGTLLGSAIIFAVIGILNQIARFIGGWKRLGIALAVIAFIGLCATTALWGN